MKKRAASLFIFIVILAITIDALPKANRLHQRAKDTIRPALYKVGLWQEEWFLFAPDAAKTNLRLTADLTCSDGMVLVWRSPDWGKTNAAERFLRFREIEFNDALTGDGYDAAWNSFAGYLVREFAAKEWNRKDVVKIDLFRHTQVVPRPGEKAPPENSTLMFTKTFTP